MLMMLACTGEAALGPVTPTHPVEDTAALPIPPNILVVIADDLGIEASACYEGAISSSRAPQPIIAALCARGLVFDDVWSYPMCSPTRATILTGRYGWRTGIGQAISTAHEPLQMEEVILPEVLGAAGYQTASVGKWHVGYNPEEGLARPNEMGWQHFSGLLDGVLDDYYSWYKVTDGTMSLVDNYATSENVDDALAWLEGREAPWLLWVGFNAPHTPLHAPPEDLQSYTLPGDDIKSRQLDYYQGMIEAMDTELGRLLDGIGEEALKNTVVIYLGDNGTVSGLNQGVYLESHGKSSLFQGGVHVPMVIAGPGVVAGERVAEMVHLTDLFATIIELAGATLPSDVDLDSVSMLPYLSAPDAPPQRTRMLTELFGPDQSDEASGRALRDDRYKLIRFFTGAEVLYDLHDDPLELNNLLKQKDAGDDVQEAHDRLLAELDAIPWEE